MNEREAGPHTVTAIEETKKQIAETLKKGSDREVKPLDGMKQLVERAGHIPLK